MTRRERRGKWALLLLTTAVIAGPVFVAALIVSRADADRWHAPLWWLGAGMGFAYLFAVNFATPLVSTRLQLICISGGSWGRYFAAWGAFFFQIASLMFFGWYLTWNWMFHDRSVGFGFTVACPVFLAYLWRRHSQELRFWVVTLGLMVNGFMLVTDGPLAVRLLAGDPARFATADPVLTAALSLLGIGAAVAVLLSPTVRAYLRFHHTGISEGPAEEPDASGLESGGCIFVSYRREDSQHPVERMYDRLVQTFGKEKVFLDIQGIPIGTRFQDVLEQRLRQASVVLVAIGPNWVGAADGAGRRRIDDPDDFVRQEVRETLAREVPLIPVLVDGAKVPRREELPGDIAGLVKYQAIPVRSGLDFDTDMQRLIEQLRRPGVTGPAEESTPAPFAIPRWVYAGGALLALALVAVLTFQLIWPHIPSTDPGNNGGIQPNGKTPVQALGIWKNSFGITGKRIPYASPDNTFLLLKERLKTARCSILIGMFGFTAEHVKDLLVDARKKRNVRVSILVQRNGWKGEEAVFRALKENGADVVFAPRGAPFFLYHVKLIVIDQTWTLVQSAILTDTGVPLLPAAPSDTGPRREGNRETGIAVESEELARYFSGVLEADMKKAREMKLDGTDGKAGPEQKPQEASPDPVKRYPFVVLDGPEPGFEKATTPSPTAHAPGAVRVLPVLSPENFMEVVPQVLAAAQESIYIQTQHLSPIGPKVRILLNGRLEIRFFAAAVGVEAGGRLGFAAAA
jgi:hypothetical protein